MQIDVLYLDRGFCTTPVMAYRQRVKQPAVLACTIRGKQGGSRQLCRGRKSLRVKPSSRNPALRFFLLGFALLLVNLWAWLRWLVARIPGPGPHRVVQFQSFVCFLRRATEHLYGVVMSISCTANS